MTVILREPSSRARERLWLRKRFEVGSVAGKLSDEERAFIDGPVNTLCAMVEAALFEDPRGGN